MRKTVVEIAEETSGSEYRIWLEGSPPELVILEEKFWVMTGSKVDLVRGWLGAVEEKVRAERLGFCLDTADTFREIQELG